MPSELCMCDCAPARVDRCHDGVVRGTTCRGSALMSTDPYVHGRATAAHARIEDGGASRDSPSNRFDVG